jgi:replicative DNA helicase
VSDAYGDLSPEPYDDAPARRIEARTGRTPPHNIQVEQSLLGVLLLSRDAIASALEIAEPAHFYRPAHQHIFEAITTLYGAGDEADVVTVADLLDRSGLLEGMGGSSALMDLQAQAPAITGARKYAEIVRENALLRRLISVGNEIAEIAYDRPEDVVKAVDQAEHLVFEVAQGRASDTMADMRSLIEQSLDRLEMLYERGEGITGTPTGFVDLDELLSGLQPNALIVVGARPAMGKTSFALNLAAHAAIEANKPTLVFSLEMGQLELSQRMLCSESRVDAMKMRDGKLDETDWTKISSGVGRLSEAPIWIDDNPALTVMDIRGRARRLKSQVGDLGLIVVDYIQLMTGRSGAESRQVEISEISRNLKILARELEVPVVGLSQLSRTLESRQDKRPMLSDLRESGAIEQDADVVMFLYRDEVYNHESPDAGIAEVIVAKHRNGPTDTIRLAFLPQYTRFANMARNPSSM